MVWFVICPHAYSSKYIFLAYLADTSYRETDVKSIPGVAKVAEDSSNESGSEEEKLEAVVRPAAATEEPGGRLTCC